MNTKHIRLLSEVQHDLILGKQFYDGNEIGVGDYFWDSLVADIESLLVYAGVHSKIFGLYRMPAKRFPYAIYYDIQDAQITIVAVLPMRRNPVWIEEQLKGRH